MKRHFKKNVAGDVLEEDVQLTFAEIEQACRVSQDRLIAMVEEGVIEPMLGFGSPWQFDGSSLKRALTVIRLEEELGVNLAGAALVIDLLDELRRLKSQLRLLQLSEPS